MPPVERSSVGNASSTPRVDPTLSGLVAPQGFVAASATLNGSLFSDLLANSIATTAAAARQTGNRPATSTRSNNSASTSRTEAANGPPAANSDAPPVKPPETTSTSNSASVRDDAANSPSRHSGENTHPNPSGIRETNADSPSVAAARPTVEPDAEKPDPSSHHESKVPVSLNDCECPVPVNTEATDAQLAADDEASQVVALDATSSMPIVQTPVQPLVPTTDGIQPVEPRSTQPVNASSQHAITETGVGDKTQTAASVRVDSQTPDSRLTQSTQSQGDSRSQVSLTPVSFVVPAESTAEAAGLEPGENRNGSNSYAASNAAQSLTTNFAPSASTTPASPITPPAHSGLYKPAASKKPTESNAASSTIVAVDATSSTATINPAAYVPSGSVVEAGDASNAESPKQQTDASETKTSSNQSGAASSTNTNSDTSSKPTHVPGFAAALLAAVTRDVSGGKTTPTEGSDRPIDGVKLRLDAGSTGNSSFLRSTLAEGAFPGTTVSTEKSAATLRQASDGIQLAIRNGREVSVSLTPGELGQITIRVSTDQGVVSAKIEAQTAAGYLALNDSLGQLRDSLQQHGLVLDRLEVSLAERSNSDTQGGTSDRNNNAWTQSGWGRQGDGSSGQPGSEGDARNDTPANDSQPTDRKSETPSRGRMQTGRLDLQV